MKFRLLCTIAAASSLFGEVACAAVNLPPLNIEKTQTSVIALPSEGFMATQLSVAYLAPFKNVVGIFAGGSDMGLCSIYTT